MVEAAAAVGVVARAVAMAEEMDEVSMVEETAVGAREVAATVAQREVAATVTVAEETAVHSGALTAEGASMAAARTARYPHR